MYELLGAFDTRRYVNVIIYPDPGAFTMWFMSSKPEALSVHSRGHLH